MTTKRQMSKTIDSLQQQLELLKGEFDFDYFFETGGFSVDFSDDEEDYGDGDIVVLFTEYNAVKRLHFSKMVDELIDTLKVIWSDDEEDMEIGRNIQKRFVEKFRSAAEKLEKFQFKPDRVVRMKVQPEPCPKCGKEGLWKLNGLGGVSNYRRSQCCGSSLEWPSGRSFTCPYLSHRDVPEGSDFNYRYGIKEVDIKKGEDGVWYWVLKYEEGE